MHRFDVELDYVQRGDMVVIIAVFHSKRSPDYWRARLDALDRE